MKARTAIGTGPRKAANHIHSFADLSRRTAIRPARGMHKSNPRSTGNAIADMHSLPTSSSPCTTKYNTMRPNGVHTPWAGSKRRKGLRRSTMATPISVIAAPATIIGVNGSRKNTTPPSTPMAGPSSSTDPTSETS